MVALCIIVYRGRKATHSAIAESYANFTVRHYGQATVVFDGCCEGLSVKDNTHQRRRKNLHPIVSFTAETEFSGKKEDFLSRDKNKVDMIALISTALIKKGMPCHSGTQTIPSLHHTVGR